MLEFEEKLYAHRKAFADKIQGLGLSSPLGITKEQVQEITKTIGMIQNSTEFVTLLFLDVLIHSCAHISEAKVSEKMVTVKQEPLLILAFKKLWSERELGEFRKLFKEYVLFYFDLLPAEVFITLKKDPALSKMRKDFPELGISVSVNIYDEFQKLRREI